LTPSIQTTHFINGFSNGDVIALSSLVIALCAMIITVWQGFLTRKHNILSVMPQLELVRVGSPGNLIHINLVNHGTGPAFIQNIYLFAGGEKLNIKTPEDFKHLCEKLDICLKTYNHTFTFCDGGTALGPDKDFILMSFPKAEDDYESSKTLVEKIFKITIEIEYTCTYKKSYKTKMVGFEPSP
jgi:hypothetical protein